MRGVVACVLLAGAVSTGCSAGPVRIDAPTLSADQARACRDLVADLPEEMAGQERREVSGDTAYGAAWGDPAIVVTCGVGSPDGLTDSSTCVSVDDTGWYVPDSVFDDLFSGEGDADVSTTELDYRPRVHLVLPGDYRPDGFPNTTAALAPLIEQHLRRVDRCR